MQCIKLKLFIKRTKTKKFIFFKNKKLLYFSDNNFYTLQSYTQITLKIINIYKYSAAKLNTKQIKTNKITIN